MSNHWTTSNNILSYFKLCKSNIEVCWDYSKCLFNLYGIMFPPELFAWSHNSKPSSLEGFHKLPNINKNKLGCCTMGVLGVDTLNIITVYNKIEITYRVSRNTLATYMFAISRLPGHLELKVWTFSWSPFNFNFKTVLILIPSI